MLSLIFCKAGEHGGGSMKYTKPAVKVAINKENSQTPRVDVQFIPVRENTLVVEISFHVACYIFKI